MTPPPFQYGDDRYDDRSVLRADVFEIAGGLCEHPVIPPGASVPRCCGAPAAELAHIQPRGMGHKGDRDTVNNTMAACTLHARSTDDRGDPAWLHVPAPGDRLALREWVQSCRRAAGWAV